MLSNPVSPAAEHDCPPSGQGLSTVWLLLLSVLPAGPRVPEERLPFALFTCSVSEAITSGMHKRSRIPCGDQEASQGVTACNMPLVD